MCGGFIFAYTNSKIDEKSSKTIQFLSHLFYNLGRINSYTFIGAMFGLIGSVFSFSRQSSGYLYFIIGILMVLMGLSLLGKIRFLTLIESNFSSSNFYKKTFSSLIHSKSMYSFYVLGILNGFLPCGLVYFFAISAAATSSAFYGALTMLIFGLSTVPTLLGLGYIISYLNGTKLRSLMVKLASGIIVMYGIYMAYKGYKAVVGF